MPFATSLYSRAVSGLAMIALNGDQVRHFAAVDCAQLVQQALSDARVDQLAVPTLAAGETLADIRSEQFDPEEAGRRGMAFEALDQLALEHLYGVA